MGKIIDKLELLKNNIAIILIIIYAVSFINYFLYYQSFNIPIFNYLGLNDLLFFCFEYAFKILLVIVIADFTLSLISTALYMVYEKCYLFKRKKLKLYFLSSKRDRLRISDIIWNKIDSWEMNFKTIIVFLGIFATVFFPYKLITVPAYLIYFIYLLEIYSTKVISKTFAFATLFIVVFFMLWSTLFYAYDKRFNKDDYVISFQERDSYISTDRSVSSLNYLGETSTSIFLYDIDNKAVSIYNKSNISSIKIQNSGKIDNFILNNKDSFWAKPFVDMFNAIND